MKNNLNFVNPRKKTQISHTKIVDLFLTYDCTLSCPHCFVQDRGKKIDMTPSILDRSIDCIVETSQSFTEIVFLGGEPTLKPLLIERAIERFKKWTEVYPINFRFSMTTNGFCLNERLINMLAEWNIHYIISIDGYGNRHDGIRPAKNGLSSFEAIKKNVDLIKQFQRKLGTRFTVSPRNVWWLAEDLSKLFEMGFDTFIIGPMTGISWPNTAVEKYINEMVSFSREREVVDGRYVPELSLIDNKDIYINIWGCGAGNGRVAIDPLGYIFACGRFTGLKREEMLVLGDIYNGIYPTGNIQLFLNSNNLERTFCENCEICNMCLGGCPALNWEENQSLILPAAMECIMNKARIEIIRRLRA